MAITLTWKITRLEVVNQGDLQNVAVQACFDISGEDEVGHKGFTQGDVMLGAPNAKTFIDIHAVTEEQAIDWVKAALGDRLDFFANQVAEQIGWQKEEKPKAIELNWIKTGE